MAEFDTGQEILRNVVRRAGEVLPTETDESDADHLIDAKLYINASYWELCALKPWTWARKRAQFVSIAQVTGSVNSISTTTVTLSAVVSTSLTGRKFVLDSDGIPVRISSHSGGSAIVTLAVSYPGTNTSGSYTIFQDEVDTGLTDILSFPRVVELHWGDDITMIPEGESRARYPRNHLGAVRAQYVSFISETAIRLVPWTQDARLFEIIYNRRPSPLDFGGGAADTPILPRDSRIAIAQRALVKIYADKRDARLEVAQRELDETLSRMSATESTFGKPRIWVPSNMRVSG